MGVSWPYLKHHPGPQPAVLGHCWRNSASRPQAAAGEEEHSPTAGALWDGAQGGSLMGLSQAPTPVCAFLQEQE